MPGKDGTGPLGRGPMTGHGGGECVLRKSKNKPGCVEGVLGKHGRPVTLEIDSEHFPVQSEVLPKRQP